MKCYNCQKEISQVDICPYCGKNQIYEKLNFNVKGVTYENEEGKDIQKEIRKIFLEYEKNGCFEKYGGYTNSEIKEMGIEVSEFEDANIEMKLEEDTYENKPCIKIYIKKYDNTYCHIGYMPKGLVRKYLKLKKFFKNMKMSINLVGGKIKQLGYDYYTDKEKVETVELTYGFEVELILYNDEKKFQDQVEKNKHKAIEELNKLKDEQEAKMQKETKDEEEKRKEQKTNARIAIVVYLGLCIFSFYIMPFGIITLLIGIIGLIASLGLAF